MTGDLILYYDVPFTSFRRERSRRYKESYPVPPFTTVFGSLLSFCGITDTKRYSGTEMAVGLLNSGNICKILRKARQQAQASSGDIPETKPGYREVLLNLKFYTLISRGDSKGDLPSRVREAHYNPQSVDRFGSFCLGESEALIRDFKLLAEDPEENYTTIAPDSSGSLILPIWTQHGSCNSVSYFERFTLKENFPLTKPEARVTLRPGNRSSTSLRRE